MKPKTIRQVLDGLATELFFANHTREENIDQALAQIQQLIEECAPDKSNLRDVGIDSLKYAELAGHNHAIDQYKSNIKEKLK